MANYMKDPRANMVSENGIFLDWCGDDTRYYYNGSYVDLCGMSPEEYMKRWCCNGSDDDNGGNSNPRENKIIVSHEPVTTESGEYAVRLAVRASKPTASDVTVTVKYEYINTETNQLETENVDVLIPAGQTTGVMMLARPSITVNSAAPSPLSDEAYDYVTDGDILSFIGCLFHGVYPATGSDDGITVGLENIIKDVTYLEDGVYNATVEIPYTYYDGKITDAVLEEHTMDMVFALDADIESFSITDPNGVSYKEFLSDVIKVISVETPDDKGHLISAFYNVYRMKSDQFVNVDNKQKGEAVPFDIKIKIQ